jgi:hypothetical protein
MSRKLSPKSGRTPGPRPAPGRPLGAVMKVILRGEERARGARADQGVRPTLEVYES